MLYPMINGRFSYYKKGTYFLDFVDMCPNKEGNDSCYMYIGVSGAAICQV